MYYFIVLGIFQFRLKYDNTPISEEKVNGVKAKALDIVKGLDKSSSPHLSKWLCQNIRSEIFVEKFYINQNIKGKTDVNFNYNFPDYLKSISSRFFITAPSKVLTFNKSSCNFPSDSMPKSSQNSPLTPLNEETSLKIDAVAKESIIKLNKNKKPINIFPNALILEGCHDINRQTINQFSKSTQNSPKLKLALSFLNQNNLSSLTYLSPREKALSYPSPKNEAHCFKTPTLSQKVEFFDLNITRPVQASYRLQNYLKKSIHNRVADNEKMF